MRKAIAIISVALAFVSVASVIGASECDNDLGAWLNCNNPRVTSYLLTLRSKDIGKMLAGVTLTDGTKVLNGYTYIGEATRLEKGSHIYVFEYKGRKVAYLWVDSGGGEISLPSCPEWPEEDCYESAYLLSGDVYTRNAARAEKGVVMVTCVRDEWLN